MTSPIRVLRQIVAPNGRHRLGRVVPLDELLGQPTAYTTPDVPDHAVLVQAWRPCSGSCDGEMPSVLHKDGSWTCGHCFTVTAASEAS